MMPGEWGGGGDSDVWAVISGGWGRRGGRHFWGETLDR